MTGLKSWNARPQRAPRAPGKPPRSPPKWSRQEVQRASRGSERFKSSERFKRCRAERRGVLLLYVYYNRFFGFFTQFFTLQHYTTTEFPCHFIMIMHGSSRRNQTNIQFCGPLLRRYLILIFCDLRWQFKFVYLKILKYLAALAWEYDQRVHQNYS